MPSTYDGERSPTRARRQRLTGTRHDGRAWTLTAKRVRRAVQDAAETAGWRPDVTADAVGDRLLTYGRQG
jgi:hypothetical protein